MHELSVCQGLMRQVQQIAEETGRRSVDLIRLRVGGLSGVEPSLLAHAFEIARAGTVAADAELEMKRARSWSSARSAGQQRRRRQPPGLRVLRRMAGKRNRGEELMLMSLEIERKG